MAVNKVIYGDQTLIDLTSDTVNSEKLKIGATAHGANGLAISGELGGIYYGTTAPTDPSTKMWVDPSGTANAYIAAPSSPNAGDFLVYNGTTWAAMSLSAWQGGSY